MINSKVINSKKVIKIKKHFKNKDNKIEGKLIKGRLEKSRIIKCSIILLFLVILSLPFILTFLLSFFSYYRYPYIVPSKFTFDYWKNLLWYNPLILKSIKNSIWIGTMNALFSTIIGFMTARVLVKEKLNNKIKVTYFYSLPLFVPTTALFIGVHMMMIRLSLMNSYIGVIVAHLLISIPYAINIGISFFEGIPTDMEQVAKSLGCSNTILFQKVILPLILPGAFFSGAICFLLSFSEYFAAFLIGGGEIITVSSLLYPYITNADYGNSATLSVVFISINLGMFFLVDHLTHRLTKVRQYLFG